MHGVGIEIDRVTHTRSFLSGGVGWDLPLLSHVFLTPSVDYTHLIVPEPAQHELRHGLSFGLGLTVK
jgi:hypothetical protein